MKIQLVVFFVLAGFAAGLAAERKQAPRKQVSAQYNPKELGVEKPRAKWQVSELDAAKKPSGAKRKRTVKK